MSSEVQRPVPEWRFMQLTLFMALWMLLSPRWEHPWISGLLLQAVIINSLFVTLWANPQWHRLRVVVLGLWGLSLVASVMALAPLPAQLRQAARTAEIVAFIPVLAACAVGIVRFIFRTRRLSADGIFATVAVYLLVAFIFAQFYLLLIIGSADAFHLPVPAQERLPQTLHSDMVYFSLITLATVGYGDVLPVSETARMLAVIEAVIGQFYVAVIVAVFVGMYAATAPGTSGTNPGGRP